MENPFLDLIPPENQGKIQQNSDMSPSDNANMSDMENPFLDLIPKKSNVEKTTDYLNYLGDSLLQGTRHAAAAPGQFFSPVVDSLFGTHHSEDINNANKYFDEKYNEKYPEGGLTGDLASFGSEIIPSMLFGGNVMKEINGIDKGIEGLKGFWGSMAKLGTNAGKGALTGAAAAPLLYDETGEFTPGEKLGLGAVTGGAMSPILTGVQKLSPFIKKGWVGLKSIASPSDKVTDDLLGDITNKEKTLSRKEAGERLGFNLTPAEASGSRLAARGQAKIGYTRDVAQQLESFQDNRAEQEKKAISSLLNKISPDDTVASRDVRKAAKSSIQEKEADLRAKSAPLYDEALFLKPDEKALVDPDRPHFKEEGKMLRNISPVAFDELNKDSIIADAISKIGKDPVWKKDLNGVPPYTVKYLDYVKKYLDDLNKTAVKQGENNRSRLLTISKNDLVNTIDSEVPQYKEARAIYGEGAQPITDLKESVIGNISKIKDKDLKLISKRIFDPTQTDSEVLRNARDEIMAQDPVAWRRMMRNEMQRRMAKVNNNSGSAFYKNVLQNENDFNHFMQASERLPNVQQKLKDMKEVLPMIFNKETTKAAKGHEESNMSMARNDLKAYVKLGKQIVARRYDRAAVDLITQGKWDKEFIKIHNIKNDSKRKDELARLFLKVVGSTIPLANTAVNNIYTQYK